MKHFSRSLDALRLGHFNEAWEFLQDKPRQLPAIERVQYSALAADIMQHLGRSSEAESITRRLLATKKVPLAARARCHAVLGQVQFEQGQPEKSLSHFSQAARLADQAEDKKYASMMHVKRMGALAEVSQAEAAIAISAEVNTRIAQFGDGQVAAALHTRLGEIEATRGHVESAEKHFNLAESLLSADPNAWLRGGLRLSRSALHYLIPNYDEAISQAFSSLDCSLESGHLRTRMAAIGNIGLLKLYKGELDPAEEYSIAALQLASRFPRSRFSLLDNFIQLQISKEQTELASRILSVIDRQIVANDAVSASWQLLAMNEARIELHLKLERWSEAEHAATIAMRQADTYSYRFLQSTFRLQRAEALTELGRGTEAAEMIAEAAGMSESLSLVTTAELERVKGKLFARIGERGRARVDFQRALRILQGVGHERGRVKTQADAERAGIALEWAERSIGADSTASREDDRKVRSDADWINSLSALLELADHPKLFAVEAFATLCGSGWTRRVSLTHGEPGTEPTLVLSHGPSTADRENADAEPCLRRWRIDAGEDSYFELGFEPEPSPTAQCQLVSWQRIAKAILALRAYRAEAKRRAAIWPIDSAAPSADGVFVASKTLENLAIAQQVAPTSMPVLITGETGTGKEILARAIHRHSNRASRPFVPYNCSAVGRDLIDSQLFGHRRGAFTGAHESTPGVIRAANGGTLFLDEIGELDLELQPKLLRFLETGEIHPLGEPKPLVVDVRVIAATNVDIDQRVVEGRFREDLYYRLNVIRLDIPPLRNRREEIPPLIQQFLQQFGSSEQRRQGLRLAEDTLEYLLLYDWPGNVRHLANEIRRLIGLAGSDSVILPAALSPAIRAARRTQPRAPTDTANGKAAESTVAVSLDQPLAQAVAELERAMLQRALAASGGHVERAARALGLSRKGLFLKRKRLGLA